MDFSAQNELEREYFRKDFSPVRELMTRIRQSVYSGEVLTAEDLQLSGIMDFKEKVSHIYITLFQQGEKPIRAGCCIRSISDSINSDIKSLRTRKRFGRFDVLNSDKCRILLEYVTEQTPAVLDEITTTEFNDQRFEIGVTGFRLNIKTEPFTGRYFYLPTDAWVKGQQQFTTALNTVLKKTPMKELCEDSAQRIEKLKTLDYEIFIIKSRAFVTYKDDILPLYRGNVFYDYSIEEMKDDALRSIDWIVRYQQDNGKFLYYYDLKNDNYIDFEHPKRTEDNLYYNELRHCGGTVALIRAHQLTGDNKFIEAAKKALQYAVSITREHSTAYGWGGYLYYEKKAKLGGTGLALVAMMMYRNETGDKTFDEVIKKYVRHILSRIYKTGEMLGYYLHPKVQKGRPLLDMTDEQRRLTFSFYYPGEALLGLGLFANNFEDDDKLKETVLEKSEFALDWLMEERPKFYSDLFTALPSDAWLMQAIEEWIKRPEFRKPSYIDFVYHDAGIMLDKMYQKDEAPYLDYEGGFYYYNYGDFFYADGSRAEGLIAAYHIAKVLGDDDMAQRLLCAMRKAAKAQRLLFNTDKNNYAHLNPQKTKDTIRFKMTRQYIRVDSIQHVACFFLRLYFAEKSLGE